MGQTSCLILSVRSVILFCVKDYQLRHL